MGRNFRDELKAQRNEVDELKQYNQEMVQSLMFDLAKLQAHIIRLDALGERLVEIAKLDENAFGFSSEVAIGGASDPDEGIIDANYLHFEKRIEQITQEIDDKTKQFDVLENILINEQIKQMTTPAGRPVAAGWISSTR